MKRRGMFVITSADMRLLEQCAVDGGMSYEELMENAGRAATECLLSERFSYDVSADTSSLFAERSVLILCGKGNNGGDGFVMARLLHERFPLMRVHVLLLCGAPTASPADTMFERLTPDETLIIDQGTDGSVLWDFYDIVVDAVYGIGFHGALSGDIADLFDRIAAMHTFTFALDIPSGMYADSEHFDKHVFRANKTVTFTAAKPCMCLPQSARFCGNVQTVSVGIGEELVARFGFYPLKLTDNEVMCCLPARVSDSHKGTYGNVLALCGSYGMAGAAMLSGKAALRVGIGLLHMCIPESIYPIVTGGLWEAVCHPLPETSDYGLSVSAAKTLSVLMQVYGRSHSALLIGPGLSLHKKTAALIIKWLPTVTIPTVIDADGLNILSAHIDTMDAIRKSEAPIVITPHPAEAARLLGCKIAEVEADRFGAARRLASMCGGVAVLKGYRTVVASASGDVAFNTTACSGLATGGSGDVLAGMLVGLMAQGVEPFCAACAAVYLHGAASLITRDRLGETAMLPTDLLDDLPVLLSKLEKRE